MDEQAAAAPPSSIKSLTIGAVCKALIQEFPDISISKIRYLEDQKLVTPRRTAGGYRLYGSDDVARLRTILRLQRDEFLPLRVIRQELARGRTLEESPAPREGRSAPRRAGVSVRDPGAWTSLEEVVEATGASPQLVAELEEYGLIGVSRSPGAPGKQGTRLYDDTDREIVRVCAELARYGVHGRNLRVFKTSADRESQLLQQLLAPSLRSRNPDRKREAMDALEDLAAVASHLNSLLLVSDLRKLVRQGQ
jgi:DNA-binding transcriptional MerR regulator